MVIEGSTTAMVFERYIEEILAPHLRQRQVMAMDNPTAHTGKKVEQLIQARGCQVLFLPLYSPDLSPIEEIFSKIKTLLRHVQARSRETLVETICQALLPITQQDAHGWFFHCGYAPAERKA